MPEQSLKINYRTSVADLATFFGSLDDNSQVRARKSGDCIVLYVRGSSNWHFLTDMLKFDFLVKWDYDAAKKTIEHIVRNSNFEKNPLHGDMPHSKSFLQNIRGHQHDFYTKEIKSELSSFSKGAADRSKDLALLSECYGLASKDKKNLLEKVNPKSTAWVTAFPDKSLQDFVWFAQNCHLKKEWVHKYNDYQAVIRLADTVLTYSPTPINDVKETEKLTLKDEEKIVRNLMIEFANQIKRHTLSTEIQLSSQTLAESEGDLIISDYHAGDSFCSTTQKLTANGENDKQEFKIHEDDPYSLFKVSSLDAGNKNAGLKIDRILWLDYEDNNPISDEGDFDRLYEEVGKRIKENIEKKQASGCDGGKDDANQSTTSHVIHVTVFNPPVIDELKTKQTELALGAFARGTSKWLRDNPNLSIHVHASQSIGISDIKAAFQSNLGKSQQRDTEQMPVSQ